MIYGLIASLSYVFKFLRKSKPGPNINLPLSSKLFFQKLIVVPLVIYKSYETLIVVSFKLKYMARASSVNFIISGGFLLAFI